MSDDTQSKRLPATWEEYQRARREAFMEGWNAPWGCKGESEAARRFPITRKVPRVVNDGHCEWRAVDGELEYKIKPYPTWQPFGYNADRIKLLADLAANPYEEIAG